MSDHPIPPDPTAARDPHSAYFDDMRESDEALDDALAAVRAEQDAGRVTPADAAAERVRLLERHLTECRRLRRRLRRELDEGRS